MKRIYIDFDSTLFNTSLLKETILKQIVSVINVNGDIISSEDVLNKIYELKKQNNSFGFSELCLSILSDYGFGKDDLEKILKEILSKACDFYYLDSIGFLETLAQKNYEINILTYAMKCDFEFQISKLSKSKIAEFVDNIIICTKQKGELHLDYENAIFIDDNPRDLTSIFRAGASPERLIRIKRSNGKYSDSQIEGFKPVEYSSLNDIIL